jgi:hypothetical protein
MNQPLQITTEIIAAVLAVWVGYKFITRSRRSAENGFKFVYVNEDGSVRELTEDERVYLTTEFHPNDGARPYIKFHFNAKTPDNKVSGYIERRQVPSSVKIQ